MSDIEVYIDPEMDRILKAKALGPDAWTVSMDEARAMSDAYYRYWNQPVPEMRQIRDVVAQDGVNVPLRLFIPPGNAKLLPVIVYLHGGGWTFGSLASHTRLMCLLACATGAAVVGVEYRLAPEHPFPAALDDTLTTWRWLQKEGKTYGLDTSRMIFAGDSAGANIALGASVALRDAGEPLPKGLALFYGCFAPIFDTESHQRFGEGYGLTMKSMKWFWYNYIGKAAFAAPDPYSAPLNADLHCLPPIYLNAAGLDPLADDTSLLAQRLVEAGVTHVVDVYPGVVHGFLQMTRELRVAREAVDAAAKSIREMLDLN